MKMEMSHRHKLRRLGDRHVCVVKLFAILFFSDIEHSKVV
jgi:hypothetical protein